MKSTPLEETCIKLGAKMTPFAGYNMPVQFAGLKKEHQQVRQKVGLFDVSHMGEFFVSGAGAEAFLQRVTTNDVSKLYPGKAQYSCMPNNDGGIVDDLLIYCLAKDHYMLVVNAANIEKDFNWLQQHCPEEVTLKDDSDGWALLAVQGPLATATLQPLTDLQLDEMKYYTFEQARFADCHDVIVSATGYTGAGGFELYVKSKDAVKVWDAVMGSGADHDIMPVGLGARDTLRLEMGLCLYGNDIDDTTSPIEAGLGWITKPDTGFINAEEFRKQKENKPERRLVGFEMIDRGIPRKDYLIKNEKGEEIGKVTSGTQAPSLNKSIGMGYVLWDYRQPGTEIFVEIRQKTLKAVVVKPPFYKG